ncbi:MAG: cation diffusion facilitator family transporter, partial [Spirochaetes bacterium]|nr:cation diffusion facilitator family transporter [Spirochaetota bacterium]
AIALVNALILVVMGAYIIHEAIARFYHPTPIQTNIMLFVALIGLGGNAISILLLREHRHESLNMKAAFLHLFFDTISSVAVVITAILMGFWNIALLDLVVALAIVGMIAYSSFGILRESWRIFMQGAPRGMNVTAVQKSLEEISGVKSVHGLHIWSVSSSEVFLSCHVCLDDAISLLNTDDLIQRINSMLRVRYNIHHTTIQIEKDRMCGLSANGRECCR